MHATADLPTGMTMQSGIEDRSNDGGFDAQRDATVTDEKANKTLVLASTSPRRRELLADAGYSFEAINAGVDDGELCPGLETEPNAWVAALAYLKARAGADHWIERAGDAPALVIGADTVCVKHGNLLGQPKDRDEAGRMIRQLSGGAHRVVTGVAMLDTSESCRTVFVDDAHVTVGEISDDEIESYLDSEAWRGKAGAYNLAERVEAGWPITCEGDPTTVMGLPMKRLGEILP
ncbi:MAG: Maf family protein [Planctomycetota bacterium]